MSILVDISNKLAKLNVLTNQYPIGVITPHS